MLLENLLDGASQQAFKILQNLNPNWKMKAKTLC